jgi:23S rRNA pseudouridine1911/1915/1917 synthase
MRLDKRIAEEFALSRRAAQNAVRRGQVDVDGRACLEPGQEVEPGASLAYHPNRPRPKRNVGHLQVLHEDSQILIVNKPAGVLTQPTSERESDSLSEHAGRYLLRKHGRIRPYVGIVHRLDKDTSGAILLVTAPRALRPFQSLFRMHAIEREYIAIVHGVFLTPSGRIELPLVADAGDRRRGVARRDSEGVPATTLYEVREAFGRACSLVACRLETGRTHQLRIHLAGIGHPVVGDRVYRSRNVVELPIRADHQALHARTLGFIHPFTGQKLRVEAPLPADLEEMIGRLRHQFSGARSS